VKPLLFAFAAAFAAAAAAAAEVAPSADALERAMAGHRIVLFGEVHDNAAQHALRAAALRRLLAKGSRPAIAFEQFDRDRQRDIDRARRERPGDADYLIAQAKGNDGWDWGLYRPFVALALEYDLPIVAANLSRGDAMRVALEGWNALFDATSRRTLGLDALPAAFERKQEDEIASGHCHLLPPEALAPQAHAQMARDIVIARSIRPTFDRGVVLLAGNGHVRRDIGVPHWLTEDERRSAVSIGLLERDDEAPEAEADAAFDVWTITERAPREDPCKGLAKRLQPPAR
jgi:uncharacterized iron-regulated protein